MAVLIAIMWGGTAILCIAKMVQNHNARKVK